MSNTGQTWPEQEWVYEWAERHGIARNVPALLELSQKLTGFRAANPAGHPILGTLVRAGTFKVGDEDSTGLFIALTHEQLAAIKHLPMLRPVVVSTPTKSEGALKEAIRDVVYMRNKRLAGEPQSDRPLHQFEIEEVDEIFEAVRPFLATNGDDPELPEDFDQLYKAFVERGQTITRLENDLAVVTRERDELKNADWQLRLRLNERRRIFFGDAPGVYCSFDELAAVQAALDRALEVIREDVISAAIIKAANAQHGTIYEIDRDARFIATRCDTFLDKYDPKRAGLGTPAARVDEWEHIRGKLVRAGTFTVGEEEATGLFIALARDALAAIKHLPMLRDVAVVSPTLLGRVASLEALLQRYILLHGPRNPEEHTLEREARDALKRQIPING